MVAKHAAPPPRTGEVSRRDGGGDSSHLAPSFQRTSISGYMGNDAQDKNPATFVHHQKESAWSEIQAEAVYCAPGEACTAGAAVFVQIGLLIAFKLS